MYALRNLGNFRGVGLEVGICGTPDTSSMRAGLKTESLKAMSRSVCLLQHRKQPWDNSWETRFHVYKISIMRNKGTDVMFSAALTKD